jgi:hypothetical protein
VPPYAIVAATSASSGNNGRRVYQAFIDTELVSRASGS